MPFHAQTVSVVLGADAWLRRAIEEALSERAGKLVVKDGSQIDISDEWAIGAFFASLGAIDHLILTGGLAAVDGAQAALDFAAAKAAFDAGFWDALAVVDAAARHLRPGGSITLTSTAPVQLSGRNGIVRPATNAALGIATKVLARELAPLRVNLVRADVEDTRPGARPPLANGGLDLTLGHLCAIDSPWLTGAVLPLRMRGQGLHAQRDPAFVAPAACGRMGRSA